MNLISLIFTRQSPFFGPIFAGHHSSFYNTIVLICVLSVFIAIIPLITAAYDLGKSAFHLRHSGLDKVKNYTPNLAVLLPIWNEEEIIRNTLETYAHTNYPMENLRIYPIDDASTDNTPLILREMQQKYPNLIYPITRPVGGEGKSYTLNVGLDYVLKDPWMEAVLITDADVLPTPNALRLMTRHLADPEIGAVTGYIREGSTPPSAMSRYIGFEYAVAVSVARRGENVSGALHCLAGGSQMHSRANLEAIGGQIDTSTFAEDTVTTLLTQMTGRKAIFEPYAEVYAEEPSSIKALWNQRLRWARGNLAVTRKFKGFWFTRKLSVSRYLPETAATHLHRESKIKGIGFGFNWFSLLAQPLLMLLASAALVALYFLNPPAAFEVFHYVAFVAALVFLFIIFLSFLYDKPTARRSWRQALTFPGLISCAILFYATFPNTWHNLMHALGALIGYQISNHWLRYTALFSYLWLVLCMVFAVFLRLLDPVIKSKYIMTPLLYLVGYGSILVAVTFNAYIDEILHRNQSWQKTVKVGKATITE